MGATGQEVYCLLPPEQSVGHGGQGRLAAALAASPTTGKEWEWEDVVVLL